MDTKMSLTVIMPALNEEKNILSSIEDTLAALSKYNLEGEVLVVNDGSSDSTAESVKKRIETANGKLRILEHAKPCGIGACFYDGVREAKGDSVVMLPGDNENDPCEIIRYCDLLKDVDIVNPFVINRQVRSLKRNIFSRLYNKIINLTFRTSLNYTNGTVIYRKSILKDLKFQDTGFFFQTYLLIKLIKQGCLYAEVPYKLRVRSGGASKALSLKTLLVLIKGYLRLIKEVYFTSKPKGLKDND